MPKVKCYYCDNMTEQQVVWLKDKRGKSCRIKLPWCGCDLMTALKQFWANPYQIVEGVDYEVEKTPEQKSPEAPDERKL